MSDEQKPGVRVTIFGDEYVIRSDRDPEYTRKCARVVDEAIQQAHLRSRAKEPHKAAILAAMEITDRYFRLRSELESLRRETAERVSAIREEVEESLPPG